MSSWQSINQWLVTMAVLANMAMGSSPRSQSPTIWPASEVAPVTWFLKIEQMTVFLSLPWKASSANFSTADPKTWYYWFNLVRQYIIDRSEQRANLPGSFSKGFISWPGLLLFKRLLCQSGLLSCSSSLWDHYLTWLGIKFCFSSFYIFYKFL